MRNVISPIHFSPVKEQKKPLYHQGHFFTTRSLDLIGSDNILEGRANSKKISIWKEEDSILAFQIPIIFCRMLNVHTTWSQLMLKLDNWRLICIPTLFLQLAGLLLATTKLQFILNLTFEKSTVENFVRLFSPHSLKLNPKKKVVLHTSTTIFASGKLQKEQKTCIHFSNDRSRLNWLRTESSIISLSWQQSAVQSISCKAARLPNLLISQ